VGAFSLFLTLALDAGDWSDIPRMETTPYTRCIRSHVDFRDYLNSTYETVKERVCEICAV